MCFIFYFTKMNVKGDLMAKDTKKMEQMLVINIHLI